ncbi:hypothetical protein ACF0H5_021242 [Mactra antiquata]
MSQNEDKFEEEFSNWAKTVIGLQNARDDSIEHIKNTMESFANKLIPKHESNEGEHFKDLLIKVAVDGNVKKIHKDKKDPTTVRWLLGDNNCSTCNEIFEELLDNFTERRCTCKQWISNSEEEQIHPSSYWWVIAKLYTINSKVRNAEGPTDVEPSTVFNLLKRCKLFAENIRIQAEKLVELRNKLMHSPSNRLTDVEMDDSFILIKDFIKLVLDKPDDAINDIEKVETSTVLLFDENGEYGEIAKKALQEQERSLNADFKSPEGIRVTIKSIAASNIELKKQEGQIKSSYEEKLNKKDEESLAQKKELESKIEEAEKEKNRYKLDDLKNRLHKETERNSDNENQFKKINTKLEKQVTEMTEERNQQREEIFLLKTALEKQVTKMTQEGNQQLEEIFLLKTALEKQVTKMTQEGNQQLEEIFLLKTALEKQVTGMTQERNKQHEEISSLKTAIQKQNTDMTDKIRNQSDEISSLRSIIKTHPVYRVKSYKDIYVRVDSDKEECFITDMCQMSDGTVVIIDSHNKRLKRLDDDYNVKDFYDLYDRPVAVVPVSSSKVAVLTRSGKIECINVDEVVRPVNVINLEVIPEYSGNGMIYCNDKIWIYCPNGIYVYSLSGSGSLMKHIKEDSQGQNYKIQNAFFNTISTNKDNTKVFVLNGNIVDVLNTDGEVLSSFPIHDKCLFMTYTTDNVFLLFSDEKVTMYDIEGNNLGDLNTGNDRLPFSLLSMLHDRNKNCLIVSFDLPSIVRVFKLDLLHVTLPGLDLST